MMLPKREKIKIKEKESNKFDLKEIKDNITLQEKS